MYHVLKENLHKTSKSPQTCFVECVPYIHQHSEISDQFAMLHRSDNIQKVQHTNEY